MFHGIAKDVGGRVLQLRKNSARWNIIYIYIYVAKLRVVDNFQNIVAGEETRVYYFEPIR